MELSQAEAKKLAAAVLNQAITDVRGREQGRKIKAAAWLLSMEAEKFIDGVGLDIEIFKMFVKNGCPKQPLY